MIEIEKSDISRAIHNIGIDSQDNVLVTSNLGRLGRLRPAGNKEKMLKIYLDALLDVIDIEKGTIIIPTYTYSYAKGKEFHQEGSEAELGMFNEFFRRQKDAVRSFHPHFSFSAIGRDAHKICDNVSRSAFGYESVFDRLLRMDAKMLFLGTNITEGMTFILYIEHMTGVSHCYHKAYFTRAFSGGVEIPGPYLTFIRHLVPGLDYNLGPFEMHLKSCGLVKESVLGSGNIQMVSCIDAFNEGYKMLQKNPCYFYSREYFITE